MDGDKTQGTRVPRRPGSSWKQRAKKLAVLAITLVLLALALEGATRLFTDTLPPLREHDAVIGGRYLPSFEGKVFNPEVNREVLVRFNADGFRGPDRALEKPPGTRRIALLGDSMVAALEVEEPETMACVLEQALDQPASGDRWEVLNFGLSGSCPPQELVLYRNLVRRYRPDVVVSVFFCGNDLSDSSPRLSNNPRVYFDLDQAGRLCQIPSSGTRRRASQWLNRYSRFYVWQQDQIRKLRDRYRTQVLGHHRNEWGPFLSDERGDFAHAWEVVAAVVRQFDREVRADGSEFVLLILPCSAQICTDYFQDLIAASGIPPERFDPDVPEDRLGEFCRQEGIRCLSLIDPFREAAPSSSTKVRQEWLFNSGCGHLNEAGNRLAAQQLFQFLTDEQGAAALAQRPATLEGDRR
jgi:hypothetical protein